MKKFFLLLTLLLLTSLSSRCAQAYDNEVGASGTDYYWKIANVQQGTTPDLATAISRCLFDSTGTGREIHVLVGGSLSGTIGRMPSNVKLFGHNNTFTIAHTGYAFYAKFAHDIEFHDMTVSGASTYVFRLTGTDNAVFDNVKIDGGFIGMRVESSDSNHPWDFKNFNLRITNCRFENLSSHGVETYSIDGCYVDGIVARNNGECGVLFNNSWNGYVGTVDAYRCSNGGGYAGLRFANGCSNFYVKYLKAIECGRGFFAVTGAKDIIVEEVYIRDCTSHAILIQNSDRVGINSGTYNGVAVNHYTSVNCWILATDINGVTITPPSAPTVPTATVSSSRVSLSWTAVTGATSYLLQRATTNGGPYRTIANLETTSYADRDLTSNTTYYYVVRAVNAAGPSPTSPQRSAVVGTFTPVVDTALGLQRHYPFDGSGADLKGGPAATIAGTATYVPGLIGQALSLDGSTNYASIPSLNGASYRDFTVATWIMPSSNANWQRVFDFGSGTTNYMMMTKTGGTLRVEIVQNGKQESLQTAAPTLDRWAHVAVTFDGNWATLYINGQPLKSVLFSNSPTHLSLSQNYIGKSQFSQDALFKGRVDDFRLYNRGLSPTEVAALVKNAPALPPFDLIAGGFGARVDLSWSPVVNATSYIVKRSSTSGGPYTNVAANLTGTTYTDTSVVANKTYYYIVTAKNPQSESVPSNEDAAETYDLSLYLKLDEASGSTAADSSGNGWNASLINGPTWVAGKINNALEFPNTAGEYATLPTGVVSGLNDFTISTWVKVGAFESFARIFDFGNDTTSYMMLTPQYATDTNAAKLRFGIKNGSAGEQQINSSTALAVDTWAHVAVTLSGNTGKMYLNGALVGTNTNMTLKPSMLGYTKLNFLGRSQFDDPRLNATLDDFRIYSRALSATEVSALANPVAASTSPIVTPSNSKVMSSLGSS